MSGIEYFDTHCHPHDTLEDCVNLDSIEITKMALMGVNPKNWCDALFAHEQSPDNTILGFGIHPWFTHEILKHVDDEEDFKNDEDEKQQKWYTDLREQLEMYPSSFMGEIGLDKKAKSKQGQGTQDEMWLGQMRAFRLQMSLAKELNRPVSAHCVGTYGMMFDLFRKWSKQNQLPQKIALHSYGGSADMAKGFLGKSLKSKIYFGFSVAINMRSPKTKNVIKSIPIDRILPETDLPSPVGMEDDIREIYKIIAEQHELSLEEAAKILNENSRLFYNCDTEEDTE